MKSKSEENNPKGAVAIGASVGAIEALSEILPRLPASFPLPVLVVVHVPARGTSALAELFDVKCDMRVKEAEDTEPLQNGTVYFAPPDYHLLVESDATLSLSNDDPVLHSRPAVDVLLWSAAEAFGDSVAGVVLTGASRDGAEGLRAICEAGGRAWVQDPATAEGTFMPEAAIESCPAAQVAPLQKISEGLIRFGKEICP